MWYALLLSLLTASYLPATLPSDDTSKDKEDSKSTANKPGDGKSSADKNKKDKELPKPKRRVGRPGDLTEEEEDRLDRILDAFIAHDIGLRPDPRTVTALRNMGPEAIPALIRALNKSAHMSDSCPVSMFHRKLVQLLSSSNDPDVLRIARASITNGGRKSQYDGLLTHLRVVASQRQAYLARVQERDSAQKGAKGSNGSRYSKEDE